MRTIPDTAASEGTSVLMCIFYGITAPGTHFMPGPAQGMSFLIKSNVIRGAGRRLRPAIDIDQGIDAPVFQQFISRNVIMCRIQTDIFRRQPAAVTAKTVYSIKKIFAVVASGIGKVHKERKFNLKFSVPAAEHVKRMAKKPCLIITVPAPAGIRIGVMPSTGAAKRAGAVTGRQVPAIR